MYNRNSVEAVNVYKPEEEQEAEHPPRILVVEDDPPVRRAIEQMARAAGFGVDIAESAETAIETLHSAAFSAAVLDVNLPGMDGLELHRWMALIRPDLADRCVFTSGDAQCEDNREYFATHRAEFLQKPFRPEQLQAALRRMIERESSLNSGSEVRRS